MDEDGTDNELLSTEAPPEETIPAAPTEEPISAPPQDPQEASAQDIIDESTPHRVNGMRPELEAALVYQESGDSKHPQGNPYAVSPAGAISDHQIMPDMWRKYGGGDPHDPKEASRVSNEIYLDELARFSGNEKLALAAYNAGSPRVIEAMTQAGYKLKDAANVDFDKINPFLKPETQNYVKSIQERAGKAQRSDASPTGAYSQGYVGNSEDVKDAVTGMAQDPSFESSDTTERFKSLNKIYQSKKNWTREAEAKFKDAASVLWDGATPDEKPSFSQLIPQPLDNLSTDPKKQKEQIDSWRAEALNDIKTAGYNPSFFGKQLDTYLDAAVVQAQQEATTRDRGRTAEILHETGQVSKFMLQQGASAITGAAALPFKWAGAEETAASIEEAPSKYLPLSEDFNFATDKATGKVKFDDYGRPVTYFQDSIAAKGTGALAQLGIFLAGGELAEAAKVPAFITGSVEGGAFALQIGNSAYNDAISEGGTHKDALTASLLALPVGVVSGVAKLDVLSGGPAWIEGLSAANKAKALATRFISKGVEGFGIGATTQTLQDAATSLAIGKNIVSPGKSVEAGAVLGVAAGLVGAVPTSHDTSLRPKLEMESGIGARWNTEDGLPPRDNPPGPGAPGKPSPEEHFNLGENLQKFQDSEATTASFDVAPKDVDPELLKVFSKNLYEFTEDGKLKVTKVPDYVAPEVDRTNIDNMNAHIEHLTRDIESSANPEDEGPLTQRKTEILRELEKAEPRAKQQAAIVGQAREALKQLRKDHADAREMLKDPANQNIGLRLMAETATEMRPHEKILKDNTAGNRVEALNNELLKVNKGIYDAKNPENVQAKRAFVESLAVSRDLLIKEHEDALHKSVEEGDRAKALEQTRQKGIGIKVNGETSYLRRVGDRWVVTDSAGEQKGGFHENYSEALKSLTKSTTAAGPKGPHSAYFDFVNKQESAIRGHHGAYLEGKKLTRATAIHPYDSISEKLLKEKFPGHLDIIKEAQSELGDTLYGSTIVNAETGKPRVLGEVKLDPQDPTEGGIILYPKRIDAHAEKLAEKYGITKNEALKVVYQETIKHENVHLAQRLRGHDFETDFKQRYKNRPHEIEAHGIGGRESENRRAAEIADSKKGTPTGERFTVEHPQLPKTEKVLGLAPAGTGENAGPREEVIQEKPVASPSRQMIRDANVRAKQMAMQKDFTPATTFAETGKGVNPRDINKAIKVLAKGLAKEAGGPAFVHEEGGRPSTRQKALGLSYKGKRLIWTAQSNDPETALHETAHQINDHLVDFKSAPLAVQTGLIKQAFEFYPDTSILTDRDIQLKEGWAMFVQNLATGQPVHKDVLDYYNKQFGAKYPAIYKGLNGLIDLAHKYYNATPLERVKAFASAEPLKPSLLDPAKNFEDKWVDANAFFHELGKASGTDIGEFVKENQSVAAARVKYNVSKGFTDTFGNKVEGARPLKDAFKAAKGHEDELMAGLLAKYTLFNRAKRGQNTGISIEDAQKILHELDTNKELAGVKTAMNLYYDWHDNMIDALSAKTPWLKHKIGEILTANRDATGARHGYYIPFYRELADIVSGSENSTAGDPFKAFKGSTKRIQNPLTAIESNMTKLWSAADRQYITKKFADLVRGDLPLAAFGREVPRNFVPEFATKAEEALDLINRNLKSKGLPTFDSSDPAVEKALEQQIAFFRPEVTPPKGANGTSMIALPDINPKTGEPTLRFIQVNPRFLDAMDNRLPDVVKAPWFNALVRRPTKLVVAGAVKANPIFYLHQISRQLSHAYMTTEGATPIPLMHEVVKSLYGELLHAASGGTKTTPLIDWIDRQGLRMSTFLGTGADINYRIERSTGKKVISLAEKGLGYAEGLFSVEDRSMRQGTVRLVAKQMGLDINNLDAATPEQKLALATAYSSKGGIDYRRQGSYSRVANMMYPLFSAKLAHLTQLPRDARANPKKFVGIGLTVMGIGIAEGIASKDDKWRQQIGAPEKDANFMTTVGDKILRVPLDTASTFFHALGLGVGEQIAREDGLKPDIIEQVQALAKEMLPGPVGETLGARKLDDLGGAIPGVLPREATEQLANRDFFFDRPIVVDSLLKAPTSAQFTAKNTEFAKELGSIMGWSPARVDHAMHSFFPSSTEFINQTESSLGVKPVTEDSHSYLDTLGAAFYRSGTTESVSERGSNEFYSQLGKYEQNKPIESNAERDTRIQLNRVHNDLTHINTILTVASDPQDRKELYEKRNALLDAGIKIAKHEKVQIPYANVDARYNQVKQMYKQKERERLREAND